EWGRGGGLGAKRWPFQGGPGAGAAPAWQPRLCQPRGLLAIGASVASPAQPQPAGEVCRGTGAAASFTGASLRDQGTAARAREPRGHDPGEEEHLLGAGAFAWGVGGGAHRRGGDRGVVRRRAGANDGTAAW